MCANFAVCVCVLMLVSSIVCNVSASVSFAACSAVSVMHAGYGGKAFYHVFFSMAVTLLL